MATIKDVAALAGVGIGTASRALSGKGSVSPATLARVQQAIEQLDFRPSRAARALMSGSSQMIGVSAPGTTDMCYTPVLQAIHATLHQAGLNMVLAFGASDGAMQAKPDGGLTFPAGHGCDGLLVLSGPEDNLNIDALRHHQVPLVMVNRALADLPGQCFTTGHARGGQLAAQALLRHGHQQFAIIGGPPHTADNNDWLRGVLAALGEAGIDTSTAWIAQSELTRAAGWDSAARLLASDHKHTALLCANDELAIGALALFHRMGVAVFCQCAHIIESFILLISTTASIELTHGITGPTSGKFLADIAV